MTRSTRKLVAWSAAAFAAVAIWSAPDRATAADAPVTRPADTGAKPRAAAERPQIEVCFVLDTTGSMSGLIDGAKQKIWSIANAIVSAKDKPQIKVALIGYRDRNDAYVTRLFDLTDDIDTVFKNLQAFDANGGGDTPESVNQALHEAVTKVAWSDRKEVARIIFLVGDAPPHMDYKDDVKYQDTLAAAAKRDIVVNAVQCGTVAGTAPVWQEIAKLGKGVYIPLTQEGGMAVIPAPQDEELAALNAKVAGTCIVYGDANDQIAAFGKMRANTHPATRPAGAAGAAAAARLSERATYNLADGGKAIQGRGDLVWDCATGVVKLADVKADKLPPEMQRMTPAEREAHVAAKQKERDALMAQIAELSKKRDEFVAAERARQAKEKPSDAFDEKVAAAVREQSEAKRK